jgi:hypothetical protein
MARKKGKGTGRPTWNFNDFKWCIDNDWQIYPIPSSRGTRLRIAIRRGGISTNGKDVHKTEEGITLTSKETIGDMEFKNIRDLSDHLPTLYKQIRQKYEK